MPNSLKSRAKRQLGKATVLLYHALDSAEEAYAPQDAADLGLAVQARSFREQLKCLADMGTRVVPLAKVLDTVHSLQSLAGESDVVLTFDDGHKSNWSLALPELTAAGAVATFYVIAGKVDKHPDYMTSRQLRELTSQGMSVGSHTMTHPFLPQLSIADAHRELSESKQRLEDMLGQEILDLALPGGHGNRRVIELAHDCGYRSVATCRVGFFRTGDDPMQLPRIEVRRGLSTEGFRATFQPSTVRRLQVLEFGKHCLRRSLGLTNYTRLRRLAHRCLNIHR